jgi:C4-dicarboxylate-specific signal transduction histidine kinase
VVEASDGQARVVVRDQGHGMNPTTLARLGTPFFTTRKNGTGLGVVIAPSIVQQHGGALMYAAGPEVGPSRPLRCRRPSVVLEVLHSPLVPPRARQDLRGPPRGPS